MAQAKASGMTEALQDRLLLTPERLKSIADDVRKVCQLADPVGQIIDGSQLDSGLNLQRRRVPLGLSVSFMKPALMSPLMWLRYV